MTLRDAAPLGEAATPGTFVNGRRATEQQAADEVARMTAARDSYFDAALRAAFERGARLLYNPPPAPADPAQDHRQIMEWLRALCDLVPVIEQTWREASLSRMSIEAAP